MEIDWSALRQVAETAGPAPDGDYLLTVETAESTRAQSSGSLMIKVKFRIAAGPHQDKAVYHNIVLKPDSSWTMHFFFETMRAFELGDDFFATNPSMDSIATSIIGRTVLAALKQDEYNGRVRNQASQFRKADASGVSVSAPSIPGIPGLPNASTAVPAAVSTPIPTNHSTTTGQIQFQPEARGVAAPSAPPGLPI